MRRAILVATVLLALGATLCAGEADAKKHHHHHHKHHAAKSNNQAAVVSKAAPASDEKKAAPASGEKKASGEAEITDKMKTLEKELAKKEQAVKGVVQKGRIEVNGPLPADFAERFTQAVGQATGCDPSEVKVIETNPVVALVQTQGGDVVEVVFEAPADVVKAVEDQAADPDSKLADGALHE